MVIDWLLVLSFFADLFTCLVACFLFRLQSFCLVGRLIAWLVVSLVEVPLSLLLLLAIFRLCFVNRDVSICIFWSVAVALLSLCLIPFGLLLLFVTAVSVIVITIAVMFVIVEKQQSSDRQEKQVRQAQKQWELFNDDICLTVRVNESASKTLR